MSKPSTVAELGRLHRLITQSFTKRIEDDIADGIPTDAATLGAAVKFLKDNACTADPADSDDLSKLRDKLKEQATARIKKTGSVLALVQEDMAKEA